MSDLGAVLDVAIGLIFMYLMTSLLVTIVQEQLATVMQLRAKNLYGAIANLVDDPALREHPEYRTLAVDLYRHPLMQSLYRRTPLPEKVSSADFVKLTRLPSYIPSRLFAIALLDVLRGKNASEAAGIDRVLAGAKEVVDKLPACQLKTTLTLLVADADPRRASFNERAHAVSERVEGWFNDSMSRTSGWYKRKAQRMSLVIGLVITVLINANTFDVAGQLWRDNALRAQVSATATAYYKEQTAVEKEPAPAGAVATRETEPRSVAAQWNQQMQSLRESSLPIGWKADVASMLPKNATGWVALLFGWLVTGLAASLGATFWFDVLGKALQIRGSGPRITESSGHKSVAVAAAAVTESGEDATSATVAVSGGG